MCVFNHVQTCIVYEGKVLIGSAGGFPQQIAHEQIKLPMVARNVWRSNTGTLVFLWRSETTFRKHTYGTRPVLLNIAFKCKHSVFVYIFP